MLVLIQECKKEQAPPDATSEQNVLIDLNQRLQSLHKQLIEIDQVLLVVCPPGMYATIPATTLAGHEAVYLMYRLHRFGTVLTI